MSPTAQPLNFPRTLDPVTVDLGDGETRILRYSLTSMKRLRQMLGKPLLGTRGALLDLDEELLPVLLYEGLRHDHIRKGVPCDCGHHAANGIDPDLELDAISLMPAKAYAYFCQRLGLALFDAVPPKKNELLEPPDHPAAPTTVN